MKRSMIIAAAAVVLLADGCTKPPSDPPNVLVIVWDTVRADRLGCYGYDKPTSPHLDRFAKDALLYERAISPGMWTLPSHASLFTGLPASGHGTTAHHQWLDSRFDTLAEILGAAGYATYAFSSNRHVSATFNFTQGFEWFDSSWDEPWIDDVEQAIEAKLIPKDESIGYEDKSDKKFPEGFYKESGPVIRDALMSWLDSRKDERPFFAFLNYMEAHIPRLPSLEARQQVMDPDLIDHSLQIDQRHVNLLAYTLGVHDYSERDIEAISGVYDASLVDLDQATHELFEALRERGVLDNTVVILTSDHGENLGDHEMFGHKYCVYNTLARVPLVIRFPPRVKPGRAAEPASVLNLFATILDLAGLPDPGPPNPSKSLFGAGAPDDQKPVFTELIAATPRALYKVSRLKDVELDWTPWLRTFQAVEHGRYKLIRGSDGSDELFDVENDRTESTSLLPAESNLAYDMGGLIDEWLTTFPTYDPSQADEDDVPKELRPKIMEQLKALGYFN